MVIDVSKLILHDIFNLDNEGIKRYGVKISANSCLE